MTRTERLQIAEEIVRRIDTVTLATCEEVTDIRNRALAGEFDDIFAGEEWWMEYLAHRIGEG